MTIVTSYLRGHQGILKETEKLVTSDDLGAAAYFGVGEEDGSLLPVGGGGVLLESVHQGVYYPSRFVNSRGTDSGTMYLLLGAWSDRNLSLAGEFVGRRSGSFSFGQRQARLAITTATGSDDSPACRWGLEKTGPATTARIRPKLVDYDGGTYLAIETEGGIGPWLSSLTYTGWSTVNPSEWDWVLDSDVSNVEDVPYSFNTWLYNNGKVWHEGTATVDSNGFLVESSPVIRLFSDRIEDNGQVGSALFVRNGVGDYTIKGTLGFAQEGWYIKTPQDANGNIKVFVEYEYTNGDISVRTFAPIYDQGKATKGDPVDVPYGRWVDIRLHEEPSAEEEADEVVPEDEKGFMGD